MGDFAGQKLLVVEKGQSLAMAQLLCLSDSSTFFSTLQGSQVSFWGWTEHFTEHLDSQEAELPSWGTGPLYSFALNLSA